MKKALQVHRRGRWQFLCLRKPGARATGWSAYNIRSHALPAFRWRSMLRFARLQVGEQVFQGFRLRWFDEMVIEAGLGRAAAVFLLAPTGERSEQGCP